jgi:FAD/FMN-containing dehydrogenase
LLQQRATDVADSTCRARAPSLCQLVPEVPIVTPIRPELDAAAVAALASDIDGLTIKPSDDAYGDARRVWNGMIDRYPALIVTCRSTADVTAAVRFGRANGLDVAVRGGGHNVAGFGTCDNGLVVDLSGLRDVVVDQQSSTATVGGGSTWGTFDAAAAEMGLHTTGGLVSTTGVGGFTLGGGLGWLMRRYGLACDNLLAAELVTASGELVRASETDDPELLWALRGGGGNFGVVTSMTFRVYPISTVVGGLMLFPIERAREVLGTFAAMCATASDDLTAMAGVLTAPSAPFVPTQLQGHPAIAISGCHVGQAEAADEELAAIRELGPTVDLFAPMPYTTLQSMLDATAPAGQRHYWKSGYVQSLDPDFVDALLESASRMPIPFSQLHLHQMGGAVARVPDSASAFGHRDAAFILNIIGTWTDPGGDASGVAWARASFSRLEPWLDGAYVNFMGAEGEGRLSAAYDDTTLERLRAVKGRLDPENVLRLNQNVAPKPHSGHSSQA